MDSRIQKLYCHLNNYSLINGPVGDFGFCYNIYTIFNGIKIGQGYLLIIF